MLQHGIHILHSEYYKSSIMSILYINFENNDKEFNFFYEKNNAKQSANIMFI